MAKSKSVFFCKNCGYQSSQWLGKCPSCNEWNSFEEEIIDRGEPAKGKSNFAQIIQSSPKKIEDISLVEIPRIHSGFSELDNVLGGGIVAGSITLLGGEPGIGKSTLLLQVAIQIQHKRILYISGEESETQLKMRSDRLFPDMKPEECYILTETNTQEIFNHIKSVQPQIVIIDSIQTLQSNLLDSAAGSISQIKECAAEFQHYAKTSAVPVFLIGHITKDGSLAGPKILEHIVDTVLQFEGDQHYGYRIVRCIKNRFGSTSELGIFEMRNNGLREVLNPSEILIADRDEDFSGSAIAAVLEGTRNMMIEIQALVSSAVYGTPQRSATGYDTRRLNMLLAVLEKRCHFKLGAKDVFLNIAGGISVDDPAINLAIVAAILSSATDIPLDIKTCFAGEMGLNGEIRPVSRIEQRIAEADKLGFKRMFLSKYNLKGFAKENLKIQLFPITKVEEIYNQLFPVD
ncbi:MAG TPA: DNA repair protein RadA [Bacteroidales bacterium]|nr:DNA repair protein RadA [Bacteroidales bacterium]HPT52086.1 DNA repair protein RadA [Bacteroidales bacterium]